MGEVLSAVGCSGRPVYTDTATWYFVRHARGTRDLGDEALELALPSADGPTWRPDPEPSLGRDGVQQARAMRRGWLREEGLDVDFQGDLPPKWHVVSSDTMVCMETAKSLLRLDALSVTPVPFLHTGLPAALCDGGGAAPGALRRHAEDPESGVREYGLQALSEVIRTMQHAGTMDVVIVIGHAVALAAIALELAELRQLKATEILLDVEQGECTALKVSQSEAAYLGGSAGAEGTRAAPAEE